MKYGKLENGVLRCAVNPLNFGGFKTYNPPAKIFEAAGYLPVVETPCPEDSGYYVSGWEKQDGKIVQTWTKADPPAEEAAAVLTPARQREQAYNTVPIVQWDGSLLTVTQAAQQWAYYAAEGDTAKTDALTTLIAQAKQTIREQYPDDDT